MKVPAAFIRELNPIQFLFRLTLLFLEKMKGINTNKNPQGKQKNSPQGIKPNPISFWSYLFLFKEKGKLDA
jgi:hypothetical protein